MVDLTAAEHQKASNTIVRSELSIRVCNQWWHAMYTRCSHVYHLSYCSRHPWHHIFTKGRTLIDNILKHEITCVDIWSTKDTSIGVFVVWFVSDYIQ